MKTSPTQRSLALKKKPKRKRRAERSPTQSTIDLLVERGWDAERVEQRITRFITRDLFNCIDVVAMRNGELAGVQVTAGGNLAKRRTKILAEPLMQRWLKAGGTLHLHSWEWRGKTGAQVWGVREEQITLGDFDSSDALRAVCEAKETG